MKTTLYKQRKNKLLCGVCAGIADKFGWNLTLTRILIGVLIYGYGAGLLIYFLLAVFLPYKEDINHDHNRCKTGPRQRKDAEIINEESNDNDGWFW